MKTSKMKWLFIAGFFGFIFGLTVGGHAQAQINLQNPACVIARVDGERIPFPLKKANTKFELAENETYLLNGTIVEINGNAYFKVDFKTQPWLGTERMLQFPYIPLDDYSVSVSQFNGRLVQMAVVARKNDSSSIAEGGASRVRLAPIMPPLPLGNGF
jgi:hypothetical protein